jgi:hypothetical protein
MKTLLGLGLALAFSIGAFGCASQQMKFQSLSKRDRLRYAACRHDVKLKLCPDDPDCDVKGAEAYAKEPPSARAQWLVDYGCSKDKIIHADRKLMEEQNKSIGYDQKK